MHVGLPGPKPGFSLARVGLITQAAMTPTSFLLTTRLMSDIPVSTPMCRYCQQPERSWHRDVSNILLAWMNGYMNERLGGPLFSAGTEPRGKVPYSAARLRRGTWAGASRKALWLFSL